MVVMLVHWLIKKGREKEFELRWQAMTVDAGKGLHREILTTIDEEVQDPKFHTFTIANPRYTTYINVGIWESVEHFDAAIGKYIPEAKEKTTEDGRTKYSIELEGFEFKLRERLVLRVIDERSGSSG